MTSRSYYDVLGVARHADAAVVQAAYRALAKLHHPDVARGSKDLAAARFRVINEAYEVLSDARRPAKYDAQLDASTTEPQAPPAPPHPTREPPRAPEADPQPHPAASERKLILQSRASENIWLIAGALIVGLVGQVSLYIVSSSLAPFSAVSWPVIQTPITLAVIGVSLVMLLPKARPSSPIGWRVVWYFLATIGLGSFLEMIGGFEP
jgi:hypothetical protein